MQPQNTNQWKDSLINVVNNWFSLRKSMYFIVIKDIFYCKNTKKIMVKYQCVNKRIGDTIAVDKFMSSPLKHATHPDQIMQIGMQIERAINILEKQKTESSEQKKEILSRFKRVFHQEKSL